jgi:hypothetical protein
MQANPVHSSVPWVVGLAIVGGAAIYLFTRKSTASAPAQQCPFPLDGDKVNSWAEASNFFAFFAPTCPPPKGYAALAKLVPGVNDVPGGVPIVAICEDTGDFWFYAGPGSTPVKRDDLRASYCKASGATAGPSAMFMV